MKRSSFMNHNAKRGRRNLNPILPYRGKFIYSLDDTGIQKMDQYGNTIWFTLLTDESIGYDVKWFHVLENGCVVFGVNDSTAGHIVEDAIGILDTDGNLLNLINEVAATSFAGVSHDGKSITLGGDYDDALIRIRDISNLHKPRTGSKDQLMPVHVVADDPALGGLFSPNGEYCGTIGFDASANIVLKVYDKDFTSLFPSGIIVAASGHQSTGGWASDTNVYLTFVNTSTYAQSVQKINFITGVAAWTHTKTVTAPYIYDGGIDSEGNIKFLAGDQSTNGLVRKLSSSTGAEVWETVITAPNCVFFHPSTVMTYAGTGGSNALLVLDGDGNSSSVTAPGTINDIQGIPWDANKLILRIAISTVYYNYLYNITEETFAVIGKSPVHLRNPIYFPGTKYGIAKEVFSGGVTPDDNFSMN